MKTKRGRPIEFKTGADKRREYFADRYQRLKTQGTWHLHKSTRATKKRTRKVNQKYEETMRVEKMLAVSERLTALERLMA